jgi:hypothetical protein
MSFQEIVCGISMLKDKGCFIKILTRMKHASV